MSDVNGSTVSSPTFVELKAMVCTVFPVHGLYIPLDTSAVVLNVTSLVVQYGGVVFKRTH